MSYYDQMTPGTEMILTIQERRPYINKDGFPEEKGVCRPVISEFTQKESSAKILDPLTEVYPKVPTRNATFRYNAWGEVCGVLQTNAEYLWLLHIQGRVENPN